MRLTGMLWALVLVGCAPAPPVRTDHLELPADWRAKHAVGAVDTRWWHHLDNGLTALVAEALAHNQNIAAAGARLDAAAAQARIAGAGQWPQLAAAGNSSRRRQNFVGFPIPGSQQQVLTTTSTSYGVSLNVSWELDLWGRLRAGGSAALADWMATAADLDGARLSLIAQTARAYWAAVEAQRQVALAQATAENARLSAGQVEYRYDRGVRSSLDLRLSRSNLAAAEAVLSQRRRQADLVKRQLELLLGRYPAAEMETPGELPVVLQSVPAGAPLELLARRPDLVAAERRLAAADARLVEARRSLYPRISLTASGGGSSAELGDLLNGDFAVWSLVGNLTQPLLSGGRLRAGVDLAAANSDQAVAVFVRHVLQACAEVEGALSADTFLAQQQEALMRAAEEAVAARDLAEQRYAAGLADLIALLEAQRRAYDAESQLLTAKRLRLDNRIDLHLALGGSFADAATTATN